MTCSDKQPPAAVWRLIEHGQGDPYWNMAVDEMLLDTAADSVPVLRFYAWDKPSVSIGYFQQIDAIRSQLPQDTGYTIVRRPTGGGAVIHDTDVTFSLVIPESLAAGAVVDSYRLINESIIRTLAGNDTLYLHPDAPAGGSQSAPRFCFKEPTRYDIIWQSVKIGGSAQRRRRGYILHQSSFFYNKCPDLIDLSAGEQKARANVRSSITQSIEKLFDITFSHCVLTDQQIGYARNLVSTRYAAAAWNRAR